MARVSKVEHVVGSKPRIGRFELLRRLATGGMAELFLARATGIEGFEKVVVLKRILPHLADDAEFVRMFLTEARLAATLNHANIVHLHDIGREAGEYFFTMEYVHGEDLRRVIRQAQKVGEPISLEHALTIITGVAAGLHHAHEQIGFDGRPLGIVHRDASPSNIILTYGGGVKVVDFGIAKAAARTNVSRLSTLKGKASYMSPEQVRGAKLDRRSDVFAIAVVLQELLTMQPVYGESNELKVMHQVASGDVPPIRSAWPECPEGLDRILARAFQREPGDRYSTALDFQLDLERFAHQQHVQLSVAALGQYLTELFGSKPYPWIEDSAVPQSSPHVDSGPPSISRTVDKPVRGRAAEPTVVPLHPAPERRETMRPDVDAPVPERRLDRERIDTVRTENPLLGGAHSAAMSDPVVTQVAFDPPRKRWGWALGVAVAVGGAGLYAMSTSAPLSAPSAIPIESTESTTPASASSAMEVVPAEARLPSAPGESSSPAEPQPAEPQPAEPQPAEPQPAEPQPAEPGHSAGLGLGRSPAGTPSAAASDQLGRPEARGAPATVDEHAEPTIELEEDQPLPPAAPKPRRPASRRPNPDPDGLLPY